MLRVLLHGNPFIRPQYSHLEYFSSEIENEDEEEERKEPTWMDGAQIC